MDNRRESLLSMYRNVRQASIAMCAPLQPEDHQVQTMEEVSPPKWNLGHTSWFFQHFLLRPRGLSLPVDDIYAHFLNSYYHRAGLRGERGKRGLATRPTVEEIYQYRASVDTRMEQLIASVPEEELEGFTFLITTGVNHEQQHQELFHTEIKHIYNENQPHLRPAYNNMAIPSSDRPAGVRDCSFIDFEAGLFEFGNVEGGWCWDNELAVHKSYLDDFSLRDRLVSNGEYLEFMEDGGYGNPLLWLADGWLEAERHQWEAPLYWERSDGKWWMFTLSGMREVDPREPVCHVSFYEAAAYANWKSQVDARYKNARLPSEREWEYAARASGANSTGGNFVENRRLHPMHSPDETDGGLIQMFGDVWEWTSSHYEPYPEFHEFPNDLSEYNGKFMNNQRVLRGGSCVTPGNHIRVSYRNFWHPAARFQFTGIRLAKGE